jgi:hypothetical protein
MGRRNERQQIYYRKTENFTADDLQTIPAHHSRKVGVRKTVKPIEAPAE